MTDVTLSDNVVFRSFGSETVLLNLTTGQYHGVKGSGGRMLEVLAETRNLEEAAAKIAAEYQQPLEVVARDMKALCAKLAERSLIELGDDQPSQAER